MIKKQTFDYDHHSSVLSDDRIHQLGLDTSEPPVAGMLWQEYFTLYPTTPTSLLKHYFPQMKDYDISNFLKGVPPSTIHKFRNRGNGGSGLSMQQSPHDIRATMAKKMQVWMEKELEITQHDFEQGLSSDNALKIVSYVVKEKGGDGPAWLTGRYLDTLTSKRKTSGHTCWCVALHEVWPGKEILGDAGIHPYMFKQQAVKKIDPEEFFEALKIYYMNHHPAMQRARVVKARKHAGPDLDNELWCYWRDSWRRFQGKGAFTNVKILREWGFDARSFKHVALSELDRMKNKDQKGDLEKRWVDGKGVRYFGVILNLLEIRLFRGTYLATAINHWSAREYYRLYPDVPKGCICCGCKLGIELHHIAERRNYPGRQFEENNVIVLCASVHRMIPDARTGSGNFQPDRYIAAREHFIKTGEKQGVIDWSQAAHGQIATEQDTSE